MEKLLGPFRDLAVALVFLTRLPIRPEGPIAMRDLAAAVQWFPLVGAIIGAIGALAYLAASLMGLPSLPAATIAVAAMVLATGALHEDGLADTADALGAGPDRERAFAIMRDSRIGSYGTIALVLVLLARAGTLTGIWEPLSFARIVISAAAFSRALMPVVMLLFTNARPNGLAADAGRPERSRVLLGLALGVALPFALLPPLVVLQTLLPAALIGLAMAAWFARRFGGYTGDTLGAVQQLTELAFLLAVLALP